MTHSFCIHLSESHDFTLQLEKNFPLTDSWYNIDYTASGGLSHTQDSDHKAHVLTHHVVLGSKKIQRRSERILPIETSILMVKAIDSCGELKLERRTDK